MVNCEMHCWYAWNAWLVLECIGEMHGMPCWWCNALMKCMECMECIVVVGMHGGCWNAWLVVVCIVEIHGMHGWWWNALLVVECMVGRGMHC